jgi:hypothetical protein
MNIMITPAEIRQKAERLYLPMLLAWLNGEPYFPHDISFRKPQASDDYITLRTGVEQLTKGSKAQRGFGYSVDLQQRQTRSYGVQSLPTRIFFETEADLLQLIGKVEEAAAFKCDAVLIRHELPQLGDWLRNNMQHVIRHAGAWPGLIEVCQYFLAHPRPNLYARQLPLTVHTKFIEEHQGILRRLLDGLLPAEAISAPERSFERRFGLRYDEPLLRVRLLDPQLQERLGLPISDLSVPLSQFEHLDLAGQCCIIIENKLTFLTLPSLPGCFAIFGSGFAVELLKGISWLADCSLIYWGDLDAHGFMILAQLRAAYPLTVSLMMDTTTLERFGHFAVAGEPGATTHLPHLTPDEHALFTYLANNNIRVEQERISYDYVLQQLQKLC